MEIIAASLFHAIAMPAVLSAGISKGGVAKRWLGMRFDGMLSESLFHTRCLIFPSPMAIGLAWDGLRCMLGA